MTRKLKISDALSLPLDAVTQKLAFLGRTGSGKTYGAMKLAEEMLEHGAQVIVIDVVGCWFGLRLAANGKDPGIGIPVFGGLHGDVPLEPTGGQLVADLVVDRGISVVIDVSQFESDSQKTRFAVDFADRFFFRKKSKPSAVHVFIEECQEVIPQNIQRGEERMLHVWQRMIRLGRNFGIGASMITQRPQDVSKKALNMAECVFAFQTTGPQERKAIDGWMADKGLDLDIAGDLPKLGVGTAHVWSPAWLKISETVKVAKKRTFDASGTPEVGATAKPRELAPIDIEKVRSQMAATIERAKENDPKALKAELARLRAENANLAARPENAAPAPKVKRVEVPVIPPKMAATLTQLVAKLEQIRVLAVQRAVVFEKEDDATQRLAPTPKHAVYGKPHTPAPPRHAPSQKAHALSPTARNGALPLGERKILTAAAQYSDGVTREQLTQLTGYKRSSRDTYVQRIAGRGLLEVHGDRIMATAAGVGELGEDFQPLPTGRDLYQHWISRLPRGEREILSKVAAHYPKPVTREEISEATGYQRSSRDTYLQRLSARRLVESVGRGEIKMAEVLA